MAVSLGGVPHARHPLFPPALLAACLMVAAPAPAAAQQDRAWEECKRHPEPDWVIFNCTAVIDGGMPRSNTRKARAHVLRAGAYERKKTIETARADLNRAVELAKANADIRMARAEFLIRQGEIEAATADIDATLEFAPNSARAWFGPRVRRAHPRRLRRRDRRARPRHRLDPRYSRARRTLPARSARPRRRRPARQARPARAADHGPARIGPVRGGLAAASRRATPPGVSKGWHDDGERQDGQGFGAAPARFRRPRPGRHRGDRGHARKIRDVFELYGFEAVETPFVEYTETLASSCRIRTAQRGRVLLPGR